MSSPLLRFLDRHVWLSLLLLTLLLYLPGTGSIPLTDRDEPRFAHATVEMMQQDSWVLPYFNSDPSQTDEQRVAMMRQGRSAADVGFRFDKPPLTYWWMRLHFWLLGVNELAARMHSVLATWLVALVIFRLGRGLHGRTAAWWGAGGWLTSLQALIHGRLCVADMPMVLFVSLAMLAVTKLLLPGNEIRRFHTWWWVLWGSLGLGFLAKGPIALLVPALALVLWQWVLWRKPLPWRTLGPGLGALFALAIVAAWGIPALIQTDGLFWKVGMGEHVVKRGTQAFNGRGILPGYYLLSALLSLLPWMLFLPRIVRHVRENWNASTALLVSWFLAPQVIFLLYATQLPHYTMPGFPAFFALLGAALAGAPETGPEEVKRKTPGGFGWVYLGLFGTLALGFIAASAWGGFITVAPLRHLLMAGGLMLCALVALGFAALWRRWLFAAGSVAALVAGLVTFGHTIRSIHPGVQLAEELRRIPPGSQAIAWQYTEPNLVFYADRTWNMLSKVERVRERIQQPRTGAVVMLVSEWTLRDWWSGLFDKDGAAARKPTQDYAKEVESVTAAAGDAFQWRDVHGFNAARSSWVVVRLLCRRTGAAPETSGAEAPARVASGSTGP